jgi:lipoate-protein ligase B
MSVPLLRVVQLGRCRYQPTDQLQRELATRRIAGALSDDILLLVEHEPVVTLGRGTRATSLPLSPEALVGRGLEVLESDRGGDVTYHGPGQLVGYPILDLTHHRQDLHWYLRQIETALIDALRQLDINGERSAGYTGVWTQGRKIASIGIHVRQWVTTHGFALNVHNDRTGFDAIVPCGIPGVEMTSVERERGAGGQGGCEVSDNAILWQSTVGAVVESFGRVFNRKPVWTSLEELREGTAAAPRA